MTDTIDVSDAQAGKVRWIAKNGYSYSYRGQSTADLAARAGVFGLEAEEAATATQAAIWYFTSGYRLTSVSGGDFGRIKTVYKYLISNADAATPADYQLTITPAEKTGQAGQLIGPFTVETSASTWDLQLRTDSSDRLELVGEGNRSLGSRANQNNGTKFWVRVPAGTSPGEASLVLTGTAPLGAGSTLKVVNSGQSVVITHNSKIPVKQTATAKVRWTTPVNITLETTATDHEDGDKVVNVDLSDGRVNDTVTINGLVPGQAYVLKGYLVDATTESQFGPTVVQRFTANRANEIKTMELPVPQNAAGHDLVVFEKLYTAGDENGTPVAQHANKTFTSQKVTVKEKPTIRTFAAEDQDKVVAVDDGDATVKDRVHYEGLDTTRDYVLQGELREVDGTWRSQTVTSRPFRPSSPSGDETMVFTVPANKAGKTLVVYERLYQGTSATGQPVATHEETNDKHQQFEVTAKPTLRTKATSDGRQNKTVDVTRGPGEVIDVAHVENLKQGETYYLQGELRTPGNTVVNGTLRGGSFEATDATMDVRLRFKVPQNVDATKLVVTERLYLGDRPDGEPIAKHEQLDNEDQTVTVKTPKPRIETSAKDAESNDENDKTVSVDAGEGHVTDTVEFFNLKVGKTYTIQGEVRTLGGNVVSGPEKVTFAAESASGSKKLTFSVPVDRAGQTLVVYERLYEGNQATGTPVATHEVAGDKHQQFKVKPRPTIQTTATNKDGTSDTIVVTSTTFKIRDHVQLSALEVGKWYTVRGELHDATTGNLIGEPLTGQFQAQRSDDSVDMVFTVPSSVNSSSIVVYENLYAGKAAEQNKEIASHRAINDPNQTVTVTKQRPSLKTTATDANGTGENDKTVSVDAGEGRVTDTVTFEKVLPGQTYTIQGEVRTLGGDIVSGPEQVTFAAESASGSKKLTFTVPVDRAGQTLVVYERLYEGNQATGTPVATHEDAGDPKQQFKVKPRPWLGTSAVDPVDKDRELPADGGSIVDTVEYRNLDTTQSYVVTGELMDKAADGTVSPTGITATSGSFVPAVANGFVTVTFPVSDQFANKTLVVFEDLHLNTVDGKVVASHRDAGDGKQTVTVGNVPRLETSAAGDKAGALGPDGGTIIDTVTYHNLEVGKQYTVTGELMVNNSGRAEATGITGKSETFTASANGTTTVSFAVPKGYAGKSLVVFEDLHRGDSSGKVVASHRDINDGDQTVTVGEHPTLKTAVGTNGEPVEIDAAGGEVVDTVTYTNLTVGEDYVVTGVLMDASTQQKTTVVGSTEFTPNSANGSVQVTFNVPGTFAGKTLVVFEKLYKASDRNTVVASHEDIADPAQTVKIREEVRPPSLRTTAVDAAEGDQELEPNGGTVVDTVTYKNLVPGTWYTVSGELMEKSGDNGTPSGIVGSKTFVAQSANGTVKVEFTVPDGNEGKTYVVFEELRVAGDDQVIASHKEIGDRNQTIVVKKKVRKPYIFTSARNAVTGNQVIPAEGGVVTDTVRYGNLVKGTSYTITGELVKLPTGEQTGIRGSASFTAPSAVGTADVTFDVPAELAGATLVVFEELHLGDANGKVVAVHKDTEDQAQTVSVEKPRPKPSLRTVAKDQADNDQVISAQGGTVVDTVTYTDLVPGAQYTISGELMNKATGESTGIGASRTFTPNTAVGTIDVEFTVPGSLAGSSLVVFETLHAGGTTAGTVVAEHKDLKDAAQTVSVEVPKGSPSIGTIAKDQADDDQVISANGGVVVDTVRYTNLTAGETYTLTGVLVNQSTGENTAVTAAKTFTAQADNGTVDVEFTVPGSLAGSTLVAFETLHAGGNAGGAVIAEHKDIADKAQTVTVETPKGTPSIGTVAKDKADNDQIIDAAGGTIVDTVDFHNLEEGKTYTLTGVLMNKITGQATDVTASKTFEADSTDGSVDVEFAVPGTLAGTTLVVFEKLYEGTTANGEVIARHENINSAAQTVTVTSPKGTPKIGTRATDKTDGDKVIASTGGVVVDTVDFHNLEADQTYTISGVLMDKITEKSTGITASKTFTPNTADGSVDVEFTVPGSFAGSTLVAFEKLHVGGDTTGVVIARHEQITDDAQTVTVERPTETPSLGTVARDKADGDQVISAEGGVVVDTVTYTNLTVGETYTITGELMNQITNQGTGVTASKTFTATSPVGFEELEFTVPGSLAGSTLVAFETLHAGNTPSGKVIAEHKDINDAAQTVTVTRPKGTPLIGTIAKDQADNDQIIDAAGGTVVDTVHYTNLEPDQTYTLTGVLMDKLTGESTGVEGSATFTPTASVGTTDVIFTVPGTLAGKTLVAFETLHAGDTPGGKVIAEHKDINDAAQTVTVTSPTTPVIGTVATDKADGDHVISAEGGVVVDTVDYNFLTPGETYTVTGVLMDKLTGESTGVEGSATFTPDTAKGSVDIEFTVPGTLAGKTLVAFETLHAGDTPGGKVIAEHKDINDQAQTVTVETPVGTPSIRTVATDKADGDKRITASGATVIDTVIYTNLTPGETYTVSGVLMNKTTGESTGIEAAKTFVADTADGSVEVEFIVAQSLPADTQLVAFEKLHEGASSTGAVIARHEDLNDAAQTVTVSGERVKPKPPAGGNAGRTETPGGSSVTGEGGSSEGGSAALVAIPLIIALLVGGFFATSQMGISVVATAPSPYVKVPIPVNAPRQSMVLAVTGDNVTDVTLVALLLLLVGAGFFAARRRRNQ